MSRLDAISPVALIRKVPFHLDRPQPYFPVFPQTAKKTLPDEDVKKLRIGSLVTLI